MVPDKSIDNSLTMVRRVFEANYSNLPIICEFVGYHAANGQISPDRIIEFEVAIDEAVSNIIRHGYEFSADSAIEIVCEHGDGAFYVHLLDSAPPFDPTTVPIPSMQQRSQLMQLGIDRGFGLQLMQAFASELRYAYSDNKNRLTLVIR